MELNSLNLNFHTQIISPNFTFDAWNTASFDNKKKLTDFLKNFECHFRNALTEMLRGRKFGVTTDAGIWNHRRSISKFKSNTFQVCTNTLKNFDKSI